MAAHGATLPDAPAGAPLVVDYTGVLDSSALSINRELIAFADSTTIEIAVVTVADLQGMDPTMYGTELGRKWGIGQKGKNNGVVIVIKPKTEDSKGQVGIAVGYGLEGLLTDATCKRIIEYEMIPFFKEEKYAGAVWSALNVIMPIVAGDYTQDQYVSSLASRPQAQASSSTTSGGDEDYPWYDYVLGVIALIILLAIPIYVIKQVFSLMFGPKSNLSGGSSTYRSRDRDDDDRRYSSSSSHSSSSSSGRSYGGGSFGGGGASGSW